MSQEVIESFNADLVDEVEANGIDLQNQTQNAEIDQ